MTGERRARYQNRDERNGQFTFDGNLQRLCVCGHTLGSHYAVAPHECCVKDCDCINRFRPSRRRPASESKP
jgi:hypothetical protein